VKKKKTKSKNKTIIVKWIIYIFLVTISIILFRWISTIALFIIFGVLTYFTVYISIKVEHVTFDTYIATSCFIGYVFGPLYGIIYSVLIGLIAFSVARLNHYTISNILIATICSIIINYIPSTFATAFIVTIIIRSIIAVPLFMMLGSNHLENFSQTVSLTLVNLTIYLPLLNLIGTIMLIW
jgi:hypothetical protein